MQTTPALAFYGGLARSRNALDTMMMMSVCARGFVGVAWALAETAVIPVPELA